MTWQKTTYGTAIAAGLILTGTLVWFESRTQVKMRDVLEIYQGLYERCAATRYTDAFTSSLFPTQAVVTNITFVFGTNDPSGAYWVEWSGTNSATTNYYRTVTATNYYVTTNHFPYGRFQVYPPKVRQTFTYLTTNKYIFGGYSNYTLSGFTGSITNFNGSYSWWKRVDHSRWRIYDVYTNHAATNVFLFDHGARGIALHSRSVMIRTTDNPEFGYSASKAVGNPVRFGPWLGTGAGSVSVQASNLWSQVLTDAYCTTSEIIYNAFDWHSIGYMIIDDGLGTMNYEVPFFTTIIPSKYHALITQINGYDGLYYATNYPYLDDSQAETNGAFEGFDILPGSDWTNFWVRTGSNIGYLQSSNYTPGTAYERTFTFSDFATNTWEQYLGYLQYYGKDWIVKKTNLVERYRLLNNCKWTRFTMRWFSNYYKYGDLNFYSVLDSLLWVAPSNNNYYYWSGTSAVSWADAKIQCEAATPVKTTSSDVPMEYTTGIYNGGKWIAHGYARKSSMKLTGIWTGNSAVVDCYVFTDRPSGFGSNAYSYGSVTNLVEDKLARFSVSNKALSASIHISAPVGSLSFPTNAWCTEPTNATIRRRGWVGVDSAKSEAVLKWNFLYCTNAIP